MSHSKSLKHVISIKFITCIVISLYTLILVIKTSKVLEVPPFSDEVEYLWLAQLVKDDFHKLFIPLNYSIMPLVIWILSLIQKISPHNNLLLFGRLTMILADIISGFLLFKIGKNLVNTSFGIIASLIYYFLPLIFFPSRIILLEPLVNLFGLASLLITIKIYKSDQFDFKKIFLLFIFLCLSYLSKPIVVVIFPAFFYLPILKIFSKRSLQSYLSLFSILLSFFLFSSIFLLPFFLLYFKYFTTYVFVSHNSTNSYLSHLKLNLFKSWIWFLTTIKIPVIILMFMSSSIIFFEKNYKLSWLLFWFLSSLFLECLFSRSFYPRHLYLLGAPIALICAYTILTIYLYKRVIAFIVVIALLLILGRDDLMIAFNPMHAPLTKEDGKQFYEDGSSGLNMDKLADKIKQLSSNQQIILLTEDNYLLYWGLGNLYNIGDVIVNPKYSLSSTDKPIFLVLNYLSDPPPQMNAQLIDIYPKIGYLSFRLYRIYPNIVSKP